MADLNRPLGQPAAYHELIVTRRLAVLQQFEGFLDASKTLVDVGCGNGASLLQLAHHFRLCHGIDISAANQHAFEAEARRRNIQNCTFSLANIDQWVEVPKQKYDRLICFEVIEHVKDDQHAAKMLYHLVKPGGLAAISVPNKWWIFETHGARLPVLKWNRVPFFSWLPTPIHERFANARIYTVSRITRLLKNAGFTLVDWHYITAPMDRVTWKPLQTVLRRTLFAQHTTSIPMLSTSIMVFAERKMD